MKPKAHTIILIICLSLMGGGCESLRTSDAPEFEKANQNQREQIDQADLQAQDAFWEFIGIPVEIAFQLLSQK
jgi:hypothetical protein